MTDIEIIYYCREHKEKVEYLPELDAYSCPGCEDVLLRDELVTTSELIKILSDTCDVMRRSER